MTDKAAQLDEAARRLRSLAKALPLTHHHAQQLLDAIAEIERIIDAGRVEAALAAGQSVCIEPGARPKIEPYGFSSAPPKTEELKP